MKFAKYLENESIPEWRKVYINYKGLKKRLKSVEKFRRANERRAAAELDHLFQGHDADSDIEQPNHGIYKTNTNTNNNRQSEHWYFPWNATTFWSSRNADDADLQRHASFPQSLIRKISARFSNDDTELGHGDSRPASIHSSATFSALEQVLLHASEPERKFFHVLNDELDKISQFYNDKENEARAKLEAIKIQMQLISEYGRRLLETEDQFIQRRHDKSGAVSDRFGLFHWFLRDTRQTLPQSLPLPHLAPMVDSTVDHHISYNVARSRLKKALTEFYRSLELLRSYKTLNETGFHKILKKFDKTAGWKASKLYLHRLNSYHWVTSLEPNKLIRETENLYINEFADGHRRRGMRKLRVSENQEVSNATTLRIGLFLGVGMSLLVHACFLAFDPKTNKQLPNIHTNIQIYACFLLPILFSLGFALNLIIWHKYRISYKFIFELDPRHNLHYNQFGELPALMLLITAFIMFVDFSQTFAPTIESELCPLILFIVLMAIMFCPFNILYCSARKWLGVALGRIVLSYCFRVEFRDFFIADELNSLSYSFWTLSYFFCAYAWRWTDLASHCTITTMWVTPFLASLPAWWRLLQCFRRYRDSRETVHLANGAKYTSSIIAIMIGAVRRMYPSTVSDIAWILTSVISSVYTSIWDVKMDWGLLQPYSRNFLLRDELVFHRWIYYIAFVTDIALRFSWIISLVRLRINPDILTYIIAIMEACRRIQWNVFRLENEHLNNCGHYRAIKEIPLPFALNETVKTIGTDEEGQIHLPNNNIDPSIHRVGVENAPTMDINSWRPITRQSSACHSLARDSVYSGSFYGRRDFENRHENEESKEGVVLSTTPQTPKPLSTIENMLTRIRTLRDDSDVSDSDRDDNDDDDDEEEEAENGSSYTLH